MPEPKPHPKASSRLDPGWLKQPQASGGLPCSCTVFWNTEISQCKLYVQQILETAKMGYSPGAALIFKDISRTVKHGVNMGKH